jgi:ribonuclease III
MNFSHENIFLAIGYTFKNVELIEAALSHRSAGAVNNERLEFLGDSIINFIIAEELYHQFPRAKEGELSRLRAHLVCGETLGAIAIELNIGQYLHLGLGERKSGGAQRNSILSDAIEAIIGAIYLDGGMSVCRKRVKLWYQQRLENLTLAVTEKDPKTRLQEFLQGKGKGLPLYTMVAVEGEPHNQTFTVKCTITSSTHFTEGIGTTRRQAEQEAAKKMLENLGHG